MGQYLPDLMFSLQLIKLGRFLSQKYKEAKCGITESTEAFQKLTNLADPSLLQRWETQEQEAQVAQMNDPSALDIYDVQLRKGEVSHLPHLHLSTECQYWKHDLGRKWSSTCCRHLSGAPVTGLR